MAGGMTQLTQAEWQRNDRKMCPIPVCASARSSLVSRRSLITYSHGKNREAVEQTSHKSLKQTSSNKFSPVIQHQAKIIMSHDGRPSYSDSSALGSESLLSILGPNSPEMSNRFSDPDSLQWPSSKNGWTKAVCVVQVCKTRCVGINSRPVPKN